MYQAIRSALQFVHLSNPPLTGSFPLTRFLAESSCRKIRRQWYSERTCVNARILETSTRSDADLIFGTFAGLVRRSLPLHDGSRGSIRTRASFQHAAVRRSQSVGRRSQAHAHLAQDGTRYRWIRDRPRRHGPHSRRRDAVRASPPYMGVRIIR
jgi:hypothetical protein